MGLGMKKNLKISVLFLMFIYKIKQIQLSILSSGLYFDIILNFMNILCVCMHVCVLLIPHATTEKKKKPLSHSLSHLIGFQFYIMLGVVQA